MMEKQSDFFSSLGMNSVTVAVGNRIVVENRFGDSTEIVTIKGNDAGLEEAYLALKKGALITEMNLLCTMEDYQWQFSIKGESLNISSLKTPETAVTENRQDLESAVLEKIYLVQKVTNLLEGLYATFIKKRITDDWTKVTVPEMIQWIQNDS
jgi:hypothetical protein